MSESQQILEAVESGFGGKALEFQVIHVSRKFEITTLIVPGKPEPELCSISTSGLWHTQGNILYPGTPTRYELTGVFEINREGAREIVAAAAFKIMRTQRLPRPGQVFLNIVHEWYPKASVPHVYITEAHEWTFPALQPFRLGPVQVKFLQIIPITDSEAQLVEEQGGTTLEEHLLGAATSIWDLRRSPCL